MMLMLIKNIVVKNLVLFLEVINPMTYYLSLYIMLGRLSQKRLDDHVVDVIFLLKQHSGLKVGGLLSTNPRR